jgi:hypothetical protein
MLAAPIGWGVYSGAVVTGAESDTAGLTPVSGTPAGRRLSARCSAERKLCIPAEFARAARCAGDCARQDRMMSVIDHVIRIIP